MLGRFCRRAAPWLARGLEDTHGGLDIAMVGARPGKICPLRDTNFCTTASRRANATTTRGRKKSAEGAGRSAQKEHSNPQEPLQFMHNPKTPSQAGGDEVLAPTLADVHLFDPEHLTYEDLGSSMADAVFEEEGKKEKEKKRSLPNPSSDPKASNETTDSHSVESAAVSDASKMEAAKVNTFYEDAEHQNLLVKNTNGDILPETDTFGARQATVSERLDLPETSHDSDAEAISKELSRASDSIQKIHEKIRKLRSMKKQYHELADRLHDRLEVIDQLIEVVEEEELRGKMSISRERQNLATKFVEKHGDPLEGINCDFKLAVTASKVLEEYLRTFGKIHHLNDKKITMGMHAQTRDLIVAVKNVRNRIVHERTFNELEDREAFRMTFYLAWYELHEFSDGKSAETLEQAILLAGKFERRIYFIAKEIGDGSWGEPSVIVAEISITEMVFLARAILDIAQKQLSTGASGDSLRESMYAGAGHFRKIFGLGKQITAKYPSAIILRDIQQLETSIAAMESLARQAKAPKRQSAAMEPKSELAAMEPESGTGRENPLSRKARRENRHLRKLLQGDHEREYQIEKERRKQAYIEMRWATRRRLRKKTAEKEEQ